MISVKISQNEMPSVKLSVPLRSVSDNSRGRKGFDGDFEVWQASRGIGPL